MMMESLVELLGASRFLLGLFVGIAITLLLTRLSSLFSLFQSSKRKIYATDHVLLNLPTRVSTWMNLGLWYPDSSESSAADAFPAACQRLASFLAQEAQLNQNDIIYDAGFGCGDQDFFWMEIFGPKSITAFNTSLSQTEIATRRTTNNTSVVFNHGDAIAGLKQSRNGSYTKIVSLDSAYHFQTRAAFLCESFRCLATDGSITLIDLTLQKTLSSMPLIPRLKLFVLAFLAGIPRANLWTQAEYAQQLRSAKFDTVSVRPISPNSSSHVFLPLARHIQASLATYDAVISPSTRAKFSSAARLMNYIGDNNIFDVVVAHGRKS